MNEVGCMMKYFCAGIEIFVKNNLINNKGDKTLCLNVTKYDGYITLFFGLSIRNFSVVLLKIHIFISFC